MNTTKQLSDAIQELVNLAYELNGAVSRLPSLPWITRWFPSVKAQARAAWALCGKVDGQLVVCSTIYENWLAHDDPSYAEMTVVLAQWERVRDKLATTLRRYSRDPSRP